MLGAGFCVFLMFYLPPTSWWRFIGWLVLGMSIYFSYGYTHSVVGRESGRPAKPAGAEPGRPRLPPRRGRACSPSPTTPGLPTLVREAMSGGARRIICGR